MHLPCYAHTLPGRPESTWEPLPTHLFEVADRAAAFCASFRSADWGRLAGLWHDLGKYRPEFQRKLRGEQIQVEHAGVGAALVERLAGPCHPLAFAIAGHHSGLPNREQQGGSSLRSLAERVRGNKDALDEVLPALPPPIAKASFPAVPAFLLVKPVSRRRLDLWTRFIFSALVDADRLATEAFYEPAKRASLQPFDTPDRLLSRLDDHLRSFRPDSPVKALRARVLSDCRNAAASPPGLFSLTVPTGGGKTLSSMAFALSHALRHEMRRVIVAIPYTSIIDQNAAVYRNVFGNHNVIEHHSNLDEAARRDANEALEIRRQLCAENWDAPLVITTNVQFFESLFSNHPSRCRKLHNVARSVIILDEAQSLPAEFLIPVLDVIRELTTNYGCSIVLSTATQPALAKRPSLPQGLDQPCEIVTKPKELFDQLKRVQVTWPEPGQVTPYTQLATELAAHKQALAIVHLRRDARLLAAMLPDDHVFHLSTLMCGAHRQAVLAGIRAALRGRLQCRVVATQLVEAGVDLDFPVVYRALAGFDSLAQAAGRCNREGLLALGDFRVFLAETPPPRGVLRIGMETTATLLKRYGPSLAFEQPNVFDEYFRMLYDKLPKDAAGIQPQREDLNFANVDHLFHLIDAAGRTSVVVPYNEEAAARLAHFRKDPTRETTRALQPFTVQLFPYERAALQKTGALEALNESLDAVAPAFDLYDARFGLKIDEKALPNPEALCL